jgi:NAD(P)-dependent dehydrogenase (short-subunit alcohol dehydrogenase family)
MSVILITGCSTGLGFATAETMARAGHTVYATMRNPQRAPQLAERAQRDKLPIIILPMDVDSDESLWDYGQNKFVDDAVRKVIETETRAFREANPELLLAQ